MEQPPQPIELSLNDLLRLAEKYIDSGVTIAQKQVLNGKQEQVYNLINAKKVKELFVQIKNKLKN